MKIVPCFVSTHKYSWGFDLRIALTSRYCPLTKKGKSEWLNTVKKRLHKGEMSLEGGKRQWKVSQKHFKAQIPSPSSTV